MTQIVQHAPGLEALINQLAKVYTKAVAGNPKDVIYSNIERAVMDCPLIVAAPDLLEALRNARKALAKQYNVAEYYDLINTMDSAIAKAEGRE